jgi:predicted MPP superfamily phosphohydrolase/adenine/guanine phosphoribosyltransferase-like PRPP-binding protein
MSNFYHILHLSDLHLGEAGTPSVFSNPKTIQSATTEFSVKVRESYPQIDICAISGDFIHGPQAHHHKDASWSAAATFVQTLRDKLHPCHFILCPGNHDIDRTALKPNGEPLEPFRSFIDTLRTSKLIPEDASNFADFYNVRSIPLDKTCITVLELNMMYHAQWFTHYASSAPLEGDNDLVANQRKTDVVPGVLNDADINRLRDALEEKWRDGLLVVIGHYPVNTLDFAQAFEECKNQTVALWSVRHLASGWGGVIRTLDSMSNESSTKQYLYLAGDTHRPLPPVWNNGNVASTVGRVSGCPSFIPFTCRCYNWPKTLQATFSYTNFIYEPDQHTSASSGAWSAIRPSGEVLSVKTPANRVTLPNPIATPIPLASSAEIHSTGSEYVGDIICSHNLFELGRFPIHNDSESVDPVQYDRLGHIRLGPILGDPEHMRIIVGSFSLWIKASIPAPLTNCLVVGIDSWGIAMASMTATEVGTRSLFMTLRGLKRKEREIDFKKSLAAFAYSNDANNNTFPLETLKNVVFVTDVIATGRTTRDAIELFRRTTGNTGAKIFACSVISAAQHWTTPQIPATVGAILPDFALPIVERSWLPAVDILTENFRALR